jgi:hypothetical protein
MSLNASKGLFMLAKFGLKFIEALFYCLAGLVALLLLKPEFNKPCAPTDIAAIVFILVGIGILLPRAIAYMRWPRIVAKVGPYRDTWDGESSASYSYEIDNQRYTRSFRSVYGSSKLSRLEICVNPNAPRITYPVFWNLWLVGVAMLAVGLFLLVSDQNYLG